MTRLKITKSSYEGNPYDSDAKSALNIAADSINFIDDRGKLVCGKEKPGRNCRSLAGSGTIHKGSGRCSRCEVN